MDYYQAGLGSARDVVSGMIRDDVLIKIRIACLNIRRAKKFNDEREESFWRGRLKGYHVVLSEKE